MGGIFFTTVLRSVSFKRFLYVLFYEGLLWCPQRIIRNDFVFVIKRSVVFKVFRSICLSKFTDVVIIGVKIYGFHAADACRGHL